MVNKAFSGILTVLDSRIVHYLEVSVRAALLFVAYELIPILVKGGVIIAPL